MFTNMKLFTFLALATAFILEQEPRKLQSTTGTQHSWTIMDSSSSLSTIKPCKRPAKTSAAIPSSPTANLEYLLCHHGQRFCVC